MKRHRRELHVMSELNLTNLLDTAFVLLIAFMLVSPVIKHGLNIDLPPVVTQTIEQKDQEKPLTIVIQKQSGPEFPDEVYLDEKRVDMEQLRDEIMLRKQGNDALAVIIDGDKDARHGTFTEVVATVQACGITRFAVSTDPNAKSRTQN